MPLYNEASFVQKTLVSVLAQDYENIEIIISDNASTDETFEICNTVAQSDPRITIHKHEENLGVSDNFQYVLDRASGTYFMWASGHDLWSPNLISECVELLETSPNAAIAFASSEWIDADDCRLPKASGWTDTRGMSPVARFFSVLWGNMHPVLGVIRTRYLREIGPIPSFTGADLIILSGLVLKGDFLHATGSTWKRREFRKAERYTDKLNRYRSEEFGLARSFIDHLFPLLSLPFALIRIVLQSSLSWLDKFGIIIALLPTLPLRYMVGKR